MLPLKHNSEYFVKYQNIILEKPMDSLKNGERQLEDILRWVCRDQVNERGPCTSHYIKKSKKSALP